MKLRKLRPEDAELMLQWMHDNSVVEHLGTNFAERLWKTASGSSLTARRRSRTSIWR